jgi:hypothetical protein
VYQIEVLLLQGVGGVKVQFHSFLPWHYMGDTGQLRALAALIPSTP